MAITRTTFKNIFLLGTDRESMPRANDNESLVKPIQAANLLLVKDLRDMVKLTCPLLAEISIEILQQAVLIEPRLNWLEPIIRPEGKTA